MAIALRQQISTTTNSQPVNLTLGSAVLAGSLLVYVFGAFNSLSTVVGSTPSDSHNTWQTNAQEDVANQGSAEIWYAMNAVAGSFALSQAIAGIGAGLQATLAEFTGVLTAGALDQHNVLNPAGAATQSSPTLTPGFPAELFIAAIGTNNASTLALTSGGWSALGSAGGVSGMGAFIIAASGNTSAQTATWSSSGSNPAAVAATSFKPITGLPFSRPPQRGMTWGYSRSAHYHHRPRAERQLESGLILCENDIETAA